MATFVTTPTGGRKLSYIVGRNTSHFEFGAAVSERFSVPEYPFWSIHVPGVLRYQVIQDSLTELHIRVQWNLHADRASAEEQMRAKIDRILGDGNRRQVVSVSIDDVTEIPLNRSGKVQITFPLGRTTN